MREEAEKIIWELRELLDRLEEAVDVPDLHNKRQQLHGLVKVVQQLEASRLPIPEEFRKLKADLIDEVGIADEAEQALTYLRNEFAGLVQRVGQPHAGGRRRGRTADAPRLDTTPKSRLREVMVECLRAMGGSGKSIEVLDAMAARLDGHLLPGDVQQRDSGELVWRNNARWERNQMVTDGVLRKDSPRGRWELA